MQRGTRIEMVFKNYQLERVDVCSDYALPKEPHPASCIMCLKETRPEPSNWIYLLEQDNFKKQLHYQGAGQPATCSQRCLVRAMVKGAD